METDSKYTEYFVRYKSSKSNLYLGTDPVRTLERAEAVAADLIASGRTEEAVVMSRDIQESPVKALPVINYKLTGLTAYVKQLKDERDRTIKVKDQCTDEWLKAKQEQLIVDLGTFINALERIIKDIEPAKPAIDYMLTGHKCEKVAEINTKLADRQIWLGKLTETYEKEPRETHCLHITTPEKQIVLGLCAADTWWLVPMGQIIHQNDKGKMLTITQIEIMVSELMKNSPNPTIESRITDILEKHGELSIYSIQTHLNKEPEIFYTLARIFEALDKLKADGLVVSRLGSPYPDSEQVISSVDFVYKLGKPEGEQGK